VGLGELGACVMDGSRTGDTKEGLGKRVDGRSARRWPGRSGIVCPDASGNTQELKTEQRHIYKRAGSRRPVLCN